MTERIIRPVSWLVILLLAAALGTVSVIRDSSKSGMHIQPQHTR
ncbi:MAG: hypothetical protein ACRD1T_20015 [Acidimicrobiia bacterium]